jgi:hypothetical protein
VIPPLQSSDFVANMENILSIYKRVYNPLYPVVCMDESPKQLIGEARTPVAAQPGSLEKHDYEYERKGVCNIFMSNEPLRGKRMVKITERKTKIDWAYFIEDISNNYPDAEKITLVKFELIWQNQVTKI